MKISVIIPCYAPTQTEKDLLGRCLDSIDERFSVELIMDGEIPEGVSRCRNRGIESALKGNPDYITFLDADDKMRSDAWEQIVGAIAEEPDEPVIQMNHLRKNQEMTYCKFFNRRGTYYPQNLPQFWVGVWNKVIRADFLEGIRFIEGLDHGEDELFVLDCLAKSRRIYCSERVAMTHYVDNKGSLSHNVKPRDLIGEQRELLRFLEKHQEDRELCEVVRIRQLELWGNPAYKSLF